MLLFVYGTLKTGYHNNILLKGAELVGPAKTVEKYRLYNNGNFPGLYKEEAHTQIDGELWVIDEEMLRRCDRLEGYHPNTPYPQDNLYRREEIKVRVDGKDMEAPAFVYFFNQKIGPHWKKMEGSVWPEPRPKLVYEQNEVQAKQGAK